MNWLQDSCRKTGRRISRSVRLCPVVDRLEQRELLAASISEFPIPSPDSGVSITQGSDGNLWFSPASEEGQPTLLASINPSTHSVTEFPLAGMTSGISSLTTGPDGNLWFVTGGSISSIGSFNLTTHAVALFPVTDTFGLGSLTFAPDGNFWFTETHLNSLQYSYFSMIGSFNPTTHQTSSFAPTSFGEVVTSLTVGPDGNLWFVGNAGISELNIITHEVTLTSLPSADGLAELITTGSDGNLWFTTGSGIGNINPTTHAVSAISPLPDEARGISPGPDGQVWFTLLDTNQVGAIDPKTDQVSLFFIPTPGTFPFGITEGPGSTLWFTESGVPQVGEVSLVSGTTTTILFPSPNPLPAGSNLTLTATVAPIGGVGVPTGTVTFTSGGLKIGTAPVNASGQATFVFSTGEQVTETPSIQFAASYSGDKEFANSFSNSVLVYFTIPDGPQVTSLQWLAFNQSSSTIILTFNEPLYAPRANTLSNYRLTNFAGKKIALSSANYNAQTNSVTLRLKQAVGVHQFYTLNVAGTGVAPLADNDGRLLDGGYTGYSGSNFVGTLAKNNLVITGPPPHVPAKHPVAPHHATRAAVRPHAAAALHRR
jgi:streptogramin lyase